MLTVRKSLDCTNFLSTQEHIIAESTLRLELLLSEIQDYGPVERLSVAAIGGISYNEIFCQCLITAPDPPRTIISQIEQMQVLSVILSMDIRSRDLLDAYLSNHISARIANLIRTTWDVRNPNWVRLDESSDLTLWRKNMILIWAVALDMEISFTTSASVTVDILQGRVLFLWERMNVLSPKHCRTSSRLHEGTSDTYILLHRAHYRLLR